MPHFEDFLPRDSMHRTFERALEESIAGSLQRLTLAPVGVRILSLDRRPEMWLRPRALEPDFIGSQVYRDSMAYDVQETLVVRLLAAGEKAPFTCRVVLQNAPYDDRTAAQAGYEIARDVARQSEDRRAEKTEIDLRINSRGHTREDVRRAAELCMHLGKSVRLVNTSQDTVRNEDLGLEVPPGGECEVPHAYTVHRAGGRPPVMHELAPQLKALRTECPTCGEIVGQADSTGEVVLWEHAAPCGRACAGRGRDHANVPNVEGECHLGADQCLTCKPKKCPQCNGSRVYGTHVVEINIFSEAVGVSAGRWEKKKETRPKPCTRCNGKGAIPGLQAAQDAGEL